MNKNLIDKNKTFLKIFYALGRGLMLGSGIGLLFTYCLSAYHCALLGGLLGLIWHSKKHVIIKRFLKNPDNRNLKGYPLFGFFRE